MIYLICIRGKEQFGLNNSNNIQGKIMKHLYCLVFCIVFLLPFSAGAEETRVHLLSGGDEQMRRKVEVTLSAVLNGVNRSHEVQLSLDFLKVNFSDIAYEEFKNLVESTKLKAVESEYRTYLLATENGYFEVRNIRVQVSMGETKGIPFQNLVFIVNKDGLIASAHFAIEDHHYQEIIQYGKAVKDLAYREKILHFIEIYRTAYNKKDLNFIRKTLSDDALIIVGYVVKTKKRDIDYLNSSYLGDEKIQFIRLGKQAYIERLHKVFQNTDFIKVQFDEVNIQRHPQFDKIYGVQLKQRWNSSFYSDEGYLFLLVDFIEETEPIIHVRAWQPEEFADGSTISIYDFEIIE
jgi:hypothetical protein